VATTRGEGARPYGVTINSLTSLSLDPPLVLFCLGRQAHTFPIFCQATSFALSILAEDQAWLSNRFSRREMEDRWLEVDSFSGESGNPLLAGAVAGIECSMERIVEGGDHVIIIGRVQALREIAPEKSPLLYVQGAYRRLAATDRTT
jgi:flavin reductase (DIM6/NTAB) family NADH-FMN oxidoreductase RutF